MHSILFQLTNNVDGDNKGQSAGRFRVETGEREGDEVRETY